MVCRKVFGNDKRVRGVGGKERRPWDQSRRYGASEDRLGQAVQADEAAPRGGARSGMEVAIRGIIETDAVIEIQLVD